MDKIVLIAESDTLITPQNGMATANMRLEINEISFPARDWNDSVLVVLSWWTHALLQLISRTSTRETVNFMEGPHSVELIMISSEILSLRAVEGPGRANEVATGRASAIRFIAELISQSGEILDTCKRRGWWSKDAEELKSSLENLNEVSTRLFE